MHSHRCSIDGWKGTSGRLNPKRAIVVYSHSFDFVCPHFTDASLGIIMLSIKGGGNDK
jgi:hypothetical protein